MVCGGKSFGGSLLYSAEVYKAARAKHTVPSHNKHPHTAIDDSNNNTTCIITMSSAHYNAIVHY